MKINFLLYFFILITNFRHIYSFNHNFNLIYKINNNKNFNKINMEYESFKNYDEVINFLPNFQSSIIINNWLEYVKNEEYYFPDYLKKSIYDMKVNIAINKDKNNYMILAWTPNYMEKRSIAYIVSGKIENNVLFLERIAQNPYYDDIFSLKFIDFLDEINLLIVHASNIHYLSLEKLNNYDIRYSLSLLIEKS